MMNGSVGILNVGAGDTKLSFDPDNPQERERAAKIVAEMLRKGYALLIQVGTKDGEPLYQRAKSFDPKTCEYIISGGPDETVDIGAEAPGKRGKHKLGARKSRVRRVKAESTRAVSVGRTAGG